MTSIAAASISESIQSASRRNPSSQYVEINTGDESADGLTNTDDHHHHHHHQNYSIKGMCYFTQYLNTFKSD
jgi:hypothetical protein